MLFRSSLIYWISPNLGATNSSTFTAIPAGFKFTSSYQGYNAEFGRTATFWSATEFTDSLDATLGLKNGQEKSLNPSKKPNGSRCKMTSADNRLWLYPKKPVY